MTYPDNHPDVREHLVKLTGPDGVVSEYMPRAQWEEAVDARDEYRRVLALISAWRFTDSRAELLDLDKLLARVGEGPEQGRTTARLVAAVRAGNL